MQFLGAVILGTKNSHSYLDYGIFFIQVQVSDFVSHFLVCNSIYAECAICYRPSVCPFVKRVDQSKMVEVRIM